MRATADGWEFVVLDLVKDCTPVQTDRFRLLVRHDGSVVMRGREVFEKLENACV